MIWMTALSAIKGFLQVNWKWLVIGVVIVVAYIKVGNWYDAYQEQQEQERTALVRMALEKQAAELSVQSLAGTLQLVMEEKRKQELLFIETLRRMDEAKAEAKAQVDVFEDHDFPALVEAKPGLIERLANKATNERMQELENALND